MVASGIKDVVAPRGHKAREEHGELPADFIRNGYSCEIWELPWMLELVSYIFAGATLRMSFDLWSLLQRLTVIK